MQARLVPVLLAALALPLAAQDALATRIDAIAKTHLGKPGAVGLSVGVARDGEVLLAKGYGIADAEFEVPADAETMFRIGSVTKQFTAAAILKLVERDVLSLEDPLGKHVLGFPTGEHEVTIRHLLNHTSGIPSYTDLGEEWEKVRPIELSHQELLALVAGKPFDFEPGAGWHYNNTGYYLLGMVLESATGKTYPEVLETEIFAPLGLRRTRYDSNGELIVNRAQGYAFRDGVLRNDDLLGMSQPGAAGALISTGGDLVRWSMALASGKVVSPESLAAMTTPTVLPDGRDTHYGFGLMLGEFEGRKCVQHGGGINGFNSMLMYLPEEKVHVAVISNGERLNSSRVARDVLYAVLGIERAEVADLTVPAELLAKLVGTYHIAELELELRVSEKDGAPVVDPVGQRQFRLRWQGGTEFRASFDTDVRLVFQADGSSFELHQGGAILLARKKS